VESVVWMIHAGTTRDGVRGRLSINSTALVFRSESKRRSDLIHMGEKSFPLEQIKKARRVRGSPVLEVRFHAPNYPRVIGFYFTQPPSLTTPEGGVVPFQTLRKHAVKRQAVMTLQRANAEKKAEVSEWAEAISRAKQG
jgi:hypothetical protein